MNEGLKTNPNKKQEWRDFKGISTLNYCKLPLAEDFKIYI